MLDARSAMITERTSEQSLNTFVLTRVTTFISKIKSIVSEMQVNTKLGICLTGENLLKNSQIGSGGFCSSKTEIESDSGP